MAADLLRSASNAAKGYGCSQQKRRRRAGGDLAARLIPLVEHRRGRLSGLFLPGVTAVTVRTPLTMYPGQCIRKLKTELLLDLAGARRRDLAERYGLAAPSGPARRGFLGSLESVRNAGTGLGTERPSQVCCVSSPFEMNLSQTNDPQEGARLVRAFLRITDPGVRSAIVRMVETMGSASSES